MGGSGHLIERGSQKIARGKGGAKARGPRSKHITGKVGAKRGHGEYGRDLAEKNGAKTQLQIG